jgi:hypothetical protein
LPKIGVAVEEPPKGEPFRTSGGDAYSIPARARLAEGRG